MANQFHSLKVQSVQKETTDCVSVVLEVPKELKQQFSFTHGQSLTLRTIINGEDVRRSYSICSAPQEGLLKVAIKKVEGGIFSSWANEQLKKGDLLQILTPTGKFNTPLKNSQTKNYLAFAAGSGITPVISIIKTTLYCEPHSKFTLVYGNRNRSSIIFFEELEALKNKYLDRFQLINILSREKTETSLHFGRIDTTKLTQLSSLIDFKHIDETFICGPEEMIFCVKDFLEQHAINPKKIHFELFTTSKKTTTEKKVFRSSSNSGPKSKIEIRLDGRSFEFEHAFNSDISLLDAALQQGADLPFACKGGVCCTCKAKLLEGEVEMDVHWGLEQEEIEQGFILTCQSHPKTEKVVVNFDAK